MKKRGELLRAAFAIMIVVCLIIPLLVVPVQASDTYPASDWCGAWSTSPVKVDLKEILKVKSSRIDLSLNDLTFRSVIQPTISGDAIRITLTNEYGKSPITINAMTCAKTGNAGNWIIRPTSLREVTFAGRTCVTIPAGETVTSDPVPLKVYAMESVAISTYMRKTTGLNTYGLIGGDTYVSFGNETKALVTSGIKMCYTGDFGEYAVIPVIKDVEVVHPGASSVVLIGDSTLANDIPLILERKLQNAGIGDIGILQQAIKGNRLMEDGAGRIGSAYGESMLKRFKRDALSKSKVSSIILKVGANDIIHPNCESMKGIAKPVTEEEMIAGYESLIQAAHARGIKIYLCTRSAWKGYTRNLLGGGDDVTWSMEIDGMRLRLNDWIRSEECDADGIIDLDFMCRDADHTELKPAYTTDGAHFTRAGQEAFVEAIPLDLFR